MSPAALRTAVATVRARLPEVSAVYLYGSHARGDARPDSDVDFALLTDGSPISGLQLWDLRGDLALIFAAPIDLVHLDVASTVLQREVVVDGLRLFAADPHAADLFELRAMREYADLMKRREGLDADIVARGYVLARG